MNYQPMLKKA